MSETFHDAPIEEGQADIATPTREIVMVLERFNYGPDVTVGRLMVPGFMCFILEPPWRNNEPYLSCVPEGLYDLRYAKYRGLQETWELVDVPDRTACMFHTGNFVRDTRGCLLPGKSLTYDGEFGVGRSREAFHEMMGLFPPRRVAYAKVRLCIRQHEPDGITVAEQRG